MNPRHKGGETKQAKAEQIQQEGEQTEICSSMPHFGILLRVITLHVDELFCFLLDHRWKFPSMLKLNRYYNCFRQPSHWISGYLCVSYVWFIAFQGPVINEPKETWLESRLAEPGLLWWETLRGRVQGQACSRNMPCGSALANCAGWRSRRAMGSELKELLLKIRELQYDFAAYSA